MQMLSRNDYMKLLDKYRNLYAMYVEYPHKSIWNANFTDASVRQAVEAHITKLGNPPILLYVHIPFCKMQCYYCTCHTTITRSYDRVKDYLKYLYAEIELIHALFREYGTKPNIKEIHLGGGSPTLLQRQEFDELISQLERISDFPYIDEFTIEVAPRAVTVETLKYYHSKGLNRLSFGVQEFDPEVQKTINRVQPASLLEGLLTPEIRDLFHGINFDIMWGLPKQTRASFQKTMDTLLKISPDRVSLLLLHYAPKVKKHQMMMKESDLPDLYDRTLMFHDAVEKLTGSEYVRIGLEHFAKPEDDLAKALKNKTAGWNSLGYTAGRYRNIIGIGTGSASTIANNYYFQNTYEFKEYKDFILKNTFPVFRGYKLNRDETIRRELIQKLRVYFTLDFAEFGNANNIIFKKYFASEINQLEEFVSDGILEIDDKSMRVTDFGKFFTMQICRKFDRNITD